MRISNKFFTIIFLLIPLTWAGSFIAGKYVVADISPVESTVLRFFLSALVMIPGLIFFRRRTHLNFSDKKLIWHLLVVVLTAGIGYHIFFFWALEYSSPTNTALIIALNPFFTAFGEIIFFKKARPLRFYGGFLLAFSGAVWVNISRGGMIDFSALGLGELFCLIAALLWSIYSIFAKMTKKDEWDSLWINAYNYLFTALVLLPFISAGFYAGMFNSISASAWNGIFYMAVFPTAIGYTLYYIGVQRKGPAWASTFIYLVPSFTAVLDHLYFSAQLTLPFIGGTVLVVTGLAAGNISRNQLKNLWNSK